MNTVNTRLFYLVASAIILFIAGCYVCQEENIYYWDFNGYWRFWQDFGAQFSHHPLSAINGVRHSIRHDDYNTLPVAVTSIFGIIPLSSRLSYILSLFTFYFVPAAIMFSLLCRQFTRVDTPVIKVLSFMLAATFSAFWAPALRGYPDICGLAFVILSVYYCTKKDFGLHLAVKNALLLGLILWMPFLLRRWYAYTIVSLYVSLPVMSFFLHSGYAYSWKKVKNLLTNFFIAGITSCLLAVIFQGPLLKRIIETNYAYIYSAYQSSFSYSVESLMNFSGLYLYPLMALGILAICFAGSRSQRILVVFCLFNLCFSFFLFTRTQSPGMQHIMPFALWELLVAAQGIFWLVSKVSHKAVQWVLTLVLSVLALAIQLHTLFGYPLPDRIAKNLPVETLPMHVDNYKDYLALEKTVNQLTAHGDKVTVLSSNQVLNDDMLNTLSHRQLEDRITYNSQVDLRDGINMLALQSKYVIVTDPPQIHLRADGQRVITVPVEAILDHQNIGQAFVRMEPGYVLDNGVKAWIYQRVRPFTSEEIGDFLQIFYQYYPQWKAIYSQGIKSALISAKIQKGDIWGAFSVDNAGVIYAHPGEHTPTTVTWVLNGIRKLQIISLSTSCNAQDTVKVTLSGADLPSEEVDVSKGKQVTLDVTRWQGKLSTLSISKNHSSGCDSLNIIAQQ